MNPTIAAIIERFTLLPHPEGGFYKETYKSNETFPKHHLPHRFSGDRYFSSAIYFLLEKDNYSAFHRIKSDECWHFYDGDPLWVHIIYPDGILQTVTLGDCEESVYQFVVPAGCWFASETAPGGLFSLVGCTVAPAFDFADFELAKAKQLMNDFPQHTELIQRLCRQ
ncbi:MAG: cupin domain-containing protein [Chitinophagaceae bacterium]|nr:cupin domain-containing protein [Chitinophagaceae bacterium]